MEIKRILIGIFIFIVVILILGGIGVGLYFLLKKSGLMPLKPVNPNPPPPPVCKNPIAAGCDPVNFCMRYECNGKVFDCRKDSNCNARYAFPVGTTAALKNASTGTQVLGGYILNAHSNIYPAVMVENKNTMFTGPISVTNTKGGITGKGNQVLVEGSDFYISWGPSSSGNSSAPYYYNQITGQIVDNLENPKSQISVSNKVYPEGTYQQMFAIPYAQATSKEIWLV